MSKADKIRNKSHRSDSAMISPTRQARLARQVAQEADNAALRAAGELTPWEQARLSRSARRVIASRLAYGTRKPLPPVTITTADRLSTRYNVSSL